MQRAMAWVQPTSQPLLFCCCLQVWFSKSQLDSDGQGKRRPRSCCLRSRGLHTSHTVPRLSLAHPITHAVRTALTPTPTAGKVVSPYQRAIMFVDNAGADVVLGMIPFARELLRMGAEVRGGGQGMAAAGVGVQVQGAVPFRQGGKGAAARLCKHGAPGLPQRLRAVP